MSQMIPQRTTLDRLLDEAERLRAVAAALDNYRALVSFAKHVQITTRSQPLRKYATALLARVENSPR